MSIVYCHNCNKNVDTDFNVEHFTEDEECIKSQEIMVNKAEYIELEASHKRLKKVLICIKTDVYWNENSPSLKWINKVIKQAK